jgi:5-methylcytosine-specific restriction endonuclease McrA
MDTLFPQQSPESCRVCTEPTVDGRWNYCSERCRMIANAVQRMFIWDAVRERVLERDDYTCQHCGITRERQKRAYWQVQEMTHDYIGQDGTVLPEHVYVESWNSGFFEVDHIQRLTDGGHPFDERNLQTLCHHCHTKKTARENSSGDEPVQLDDSPEERPEIELDEYIQR